MRKYPRQLLCCVCHKPSYFFYSHVFVIVGAANLLFFVVAAAQTGVAATLPVHESLLNSDTVAIECEPSTSTYQSMLLTRFTRLTIYTCFQLLFNLFSMDMANDTCFPYSRCDSRCLLSRLSWFGYMLAFTYSSM